MNDPLDYQEPLRLPKSFGEDEKELVNLIKKDILENKQNPIRLNDVVGLVRIKLIFYKNNAKPPIVKKLHDSDPDFRPTRTKILGNVVHFFLYFDFQNL